VLTAKKVGFVNDGTPFYSNPLRASWCDIFLNVPASTNNKSNHTKNSFSHEKTPSPELECVFDKFPKSKGKVVPQHTYGRAGGRGSIAPTYSRPRGEWSASRPGCALPPGKGPPVPIGQEAGWAPELVWTQMLEEKSFASAGDRTSIARTSST
jgi:hypothetical protein